ncbi:MAG: hypothetical protein A2X52_04515 [Candidatus Rokubacteria bacterium GWC2_70_16]|nr:MAG: hypothetical protein A2X52_04515 [Candidatus Rokubacteria bacterium GWC2_70_16]
MMARCALVALSAALVLAGCGGGTAPAPPGPPAPGPVATPPPPPKPPGLAAQPEAGPPLPPIPYEVKQRRDPFSPVVVSQGGKGLQVGSVKLVGIIQGRQSPLALVEAPDGIGYILKPSDTLGDGRVTQIGPDSVTFAVPGAPGQKPGSVTLRLRTD